MIMIDEEGLITSVFYFAIFIHHSLTCLFEFGPIYSKLLNPKTYHHRFWLMGVVFRRSHRRFISTVVVFTLLLIYFSSSATASPDQDLRGGLVESTKEAGGSGLPGRIVDRKRLGGPGSAPPICRSKCGKCEPCKAVHVPIQPGLIAPLEYYPEAWRCKCGNKISMP
ncbi:unnamed protein product [Brassica rapa]|uniref:Epidermal patterning factor-like protein n=4 Tax=Brassica TaxID=3705 RepID=A0A816Y1M6_BRANA|nr:EPIDERMAL PATTERNING FACTOR-like protein 5 [Brassica napus]CAF2153453.1 unnamed protein product [Brassica napus]CAG7889489.1 unnamed protein product [Brassica rapa]